MNWIRIAVLMLGFVASGRHVSAQINEPFSGDMEVEKKKDDSGIKMTDHFRLGLPKQAIPPAQYPDCKMIILADDRELAAGYGRTKYAVRLLIAILKKEALAEGDFKSPVAHGGTRSGQQLIVGVRMMKPDGTVRVLDMKDVRIEDVGGKESWRGRPKRLVISVPGLEVGSILQVETEVELRGSNFLSTILNELYEFGDGESPILNARLMLTYPEGASVGVFTFPQDNWIYQDHGEVFKDLGNTQSWRYSKPMEPPRAVAYLPAEVLVQPAILVHMQEKGKDGMFDKEILRTWEDVIKDEVTWRSRFYNSQALPKQVKAIDALGPDPAARVEDLRRKLLAVEEEVRSKKQDIFASAAMPNWFLGYLIQKNVPVRFVFSAFRGPYFDSSRVAAASITGPVVAADGPGGPVYFFPYNLHRAGGQVPGYLQGMPAFTWTKEGGLTQLTLPTIPAGKSVRRFHFAGALGADGSLSGKASVQVEGAGEGTWRDLANEWKAGEMEREITEVLKARTPSLSVAKPEMDDPRKTAGSRVFEMRAEVNVTGFAVDEGGSFAMPALLLSPVIDLGDFPTARKFPVGFDIPETLEEWIQIQMPEGMRMEDDELVVDKRSEDLSYRLEVHQNGSALEIRRTLVFLNTDVPLARYADFRSVMAEAAKADRTEIVLSP